MIVTAEIAAERAANGVRFLDTNAPNWRVRVGSSFDLTNPFRCILAKVYDTDYYTATRLIGMSETEAEHHGFTIVPAYDEGSKEWDEAAIDAEWEALQAAWMSEVRAVA